MKEITYSIPVVFLSVQSVDRMLIEDEFQLFVMHCAVDDLIST